MRVLKDHLNFARELLIQRTGNFSVDALTFVKNLAAGGGQDTQNGAADGGLAGAALAHKTEGLAFIDGETGVLHRRIGFAPAAVGHL